MSQLRVAVVGVGALGRHHARILAGFDDVDLVAVADTSAENGQKIAELHESTSDEKAYHEQLRQIVAIDAGAGSERTERVRYLAARSALVHPDRGRARVPRNPRHLPSRGPLRTCLS